MNEVAPASERAKRPSASVRNRAYTAAVAAVALPGALLLLGKSIYGMILVERFQDWGFGKRSGALFVLLLAGFELRWLGDLIGLIRARGRVDVLYAICMAPSAVAARRRRRLVVGAVAIGSLAAFGAAEVVFRLLDIRPPPRPRSAAADHFAVDNTLNILGLREDWSSLPEDDTRLCILFLGDSMVYGDGVERDECFCHLVERLVDPEVSRGVITINAGFPGTDPARQLEHYQAIRLSIRPVIVVQVVYPNDLEIDMHRRLDEIYRIRDGDLWVGEGSYLLRYAERQIRYRIAWKQTLDYFRGGRDSTSRDAAWQRLEQSLSATAALAHGDGAVYALVLFPWLVRLDDYPLGDVHARMEGVARRLKVPYLDLLPTFAGRDAEKLRVSLANEHPNLDGHRLAAARIADFLRAEVLPSVRH